MAAGEKELEAGRMKDALYGVFPGVYFTVMSVIQGVAMAVLATNTFNLLKSTVDLTDTIKLCVYSLLSFTGMIVNTFEYAYYIALVRRPPLLTDIAVPFILGMSQIAPLFFLDRPQYWWLATGIYALAGSVAYFNSHRKLRYEKQVISLRVFHSIIDVENFERMTCKHIRFSFGIAVLCIANSILVAQNLSLKWIEVPLMIIGLAFLAAIVSVSRTYLGSIYLRLGISPAAPLAGETSEIERDVR